MWLGAALIHSGYRHSTASCLSTAMLLSVTLMHTLQGSLTDAVAHFLQEKIPTPPAEDRGAAYGAHL